MTSTRRSTPKTFKVVITFLGSGQRMKKRLLYTGSL